MKDEPSLVSLPRNLKLVDGQRKTLPSQLKPRESYSVWEIIKPNLGKDFSRFTVPVFLNEPLCFLQRLSEYMQYTDVLDHAAAQSDPVERMAYVTAFVVSALSANWNRLSKPFNPLLLETYEMERGGVRFIAEQVSHHPPISAIHAENANFVITATVSPKLSVGLNKLICTPCARFRITLKKHNESYCYEGPTCTIYNVMMGKMYMNLTGNMNIKCEATKLDTVLSFDAGRGWHIKTTDVHIDGHIMHGKAKVRSLYGNWAYYLASCSPETFKTHYSAWQKVFVESLQPGNDQLAAMMPNSRVLWSANKLLPECEKQFFFSYYTLSLNEMTDELRGRLPPTDCRLRQDMRSLENGQIDEAEDRKHSLEEGQRLRRRLGAGNMPRWFKPGGEFGWQFTGEYWRRDWSGCTDIFLARTSTDSSVDSSVDSSCTGSVSSSSNMSTSTNSSPSTSTMDTKNNSTGS